MKEPRIIEINIPRRRESRGIKGPIEKVKVVPLEDIRQMIEELKELDVYPHWKQRNNYQDGYHNALKDVLKKLKPLKEGK